MRTENRTKTARISLLTVVHLSTLVSCRALLLHCEVVLSHHPPHHSQLVWTWAATFHGRHCLPQKVSMHHLHVVAGFWSCSTSVAQWDRKAGEGEENQEEQVDSHLVSTLSMKDQNCNNNKKNEIVVLVNLATFWLSQCYKNAVHVESSVRLRNFYSNINSPHQYPNFLISVQVRSQKFGEAFYLT